MQTSPPSSAEQEPANDAQSFEAAANEKAPGFIAEFWDFLVHEPSWWIVPIVLVLLVIGGFLILGGTAAAPFIYTLW